MWVAFESSRAVNLANEGAATWQMGRHLCNELQYIYSTKRGEALPSACCLRDHEASCLSYPHDLQGETGLVVERLHLCRHFNDWVTHRRQTVSPVGGSEDLALHDASPVADGDELHGLPILLEVGTADDDEATDGDSLAVVAVEFSDVAVGLPGDLRVAVERVSADRVAEECRLLMQPLAAYFLSIPIAASWCPLTSLPIATHDLERRRSV